MHGLLGGHGESPAWRIQRQCVQYLLTWFVCEQLGQRNLQRLLAGLVRKSKWSICLRHVCAGPLLLHGHTDRVLPRHV